MTGRIALIEPKFPRMRGACYDIGLEVAHRASDVKAIVRMVNEEHEASGAVNAVTYEHVAGWIRSGSADSFIARDHSEGDKAAAHTAVIRWSSHCFEIRSIVVQSRYRGLGVYGNMSDSIIRAIFEKDPSATVVMIKNKRSQGYRLLPKKGFAWVPLDEVLGMGLELESPSGRYAYVLTKGAYGEAKDAGYVLAAAHRQG